MPKPQVSMPPKYLYCVYFLKSKVKVLSPSTKFWNSDLILALTVPPDGGTVVHCSAKPTVISTGRVKMLLLSIHPGEGAANVGTSLFIGTAFFGIPNEKSRVFPMKSAIPLL